MPTKRGILGVAAALAKGARAGIIDSRNGNASVTPAPRKTARREMCFCVMNIFYAPSILKILLRASNVHGSFCLPVHLEGVAHDDAHHPRRNMIAVPAGFAYNRA